jgi:hypothetical protein
LQVPDIELMARDPAVPRPFIRRLELPRLGPVASSHHSPTSSGPVKPRPPYAEKYLPNMRPNGRLYIKVAMGATKLSSIFNAANDAVEQPLSKTSLAQMRNAASLNLPKTVTDTNMFNLKE